MARVFLSYDREDGAKARAIAQALERAGHFVWWDLHIKGGAEYGREIEQALEKSDAVVVLWSENSVKSAWVRDEAAAGRDSGRLIPILIEPIAPPMGFRQYQGLDFSAWKGRGKPPRMAELLESIEAIARAGGGKPAQLIAKPVPSTMPGRPLPKWLLIGGGVMLALLILGPILGLVIRDKDEPRGVQTIAVTAVDASARPLARDLLVKLSTLQGAKSGAMRLLSQDKSQKADFMFEMAGDTDRTQLGANLVLISGKDREILWSKDFEQPSGHVADLKQQIAYTAARVLGCALEGLSAGGRPLAQQTLKLYLNACAELTEGAGAAADPRAIIPTFAEVVKQAPRFAPGWSGLLIAQVEATSFLNTGTGVDPAATQALEQRIEQARKLHPRLPEIRIAELSLLPSDAHLERMRLIDEAKSESPENPAVLINRADELLAVGRNNESIDDAAHALAVEPLSPFTFGAYISALSYSGRIDAAREQLTKAERLWPGTAVLLDLQYRFHLRFGDPKEALRLSNSFAPGRGVGLFLQARAEPSKANVEAMKDYATKGVQGDIGALAFVAQAFGEFQLNDELYKIVLAWRPGNELAELSDIWFRPPLDGFRRDPRFMLVMKKTGHLDYWRKSGKWPDFCRDPDLPYNCKAEAARLG